MMKKSQMFSLSKMSESKKKKIDTDWIEQEFSGCQFKDERIDKRFKSILNQLWTGIGEPIPYACADWANTKAAYRFFSNDRVSEKEILQGHFQSTKDRFSEAKGPILVLQDTTEFSYKRKNKPNWHHT